MRNCAPPWERRHAGTSRVSRTLPGLRGWGGRSTPPRGR